MALSPEYLQGLPEELENLALQFEADIIADISRRVSKAGRITDTAEYEMILLKEMGAATDYLEKLTAQYLGVSDQTVKDMVFDAAQTDSNFYETVYASANRPYVPFEYNAYLQQLADAAVNQTCGELTNFTRSMGFSARGSDGRIYFKSAAKTYRSAMDKAFFYAAAGMDYQTAVRRATREITASGLQFVDYASGVRNHVDVAVRRALLTGVSQMTGQISLHNAGELDTDVVEVSAHAGARPDHAEWQGRWYSLTGKDKRYPLLADVTGYGSVEGLKGANCRHDFYPVIPDVSVPAYTDEQLKNIDPEPVEIDGKTYTLYEAQQKQRAYERAIRKTKREIIAAEASGDNDMFTAKSVLLRRQKAAYGKFSKEAGLLPRIERTGVAEYGRSISAKAVWADRKKGLTNGGGSGTMSSGKSSGSGSTTSPTEVPQNVGTIDFSDKAAINRVLSHYQNEWKDLDYEMDCTITSDGRVWVTKGSSGAVHPELIETMDNGCSLKGSYSYHNHPAAETNYSLSECDVGFFFEYKCSYSKAADDKYEYYMRRTADTLDLDYATSKHRFCEIIKYDVTQYTIDNNIDIDEDGYHLTMQYLAKELGFEYERRTL